MFDSILDCTYNTKLFNELVARFEDAIQRRYQNPEGYVYNRIVELENWDCDDKYEKYGLNDLDCYGLHEFHYGPNKVKIVKEGENIGIYFYGIAKYDSDFRNHMYECNFCVKPENLRPIDWYEKGKLDFYDMVNDAMRTAPRD